MTLPKPGRLLRGLLVAALAASFCAGCAGAPLPPRDLPEATGSVPGIVPLTREQDDLIADL